MRSRSSYILRGVVLSLVIAGTLAAVRGSGEVSPALLFYLSADRGLVADIAHGDAEPNFADLVKVVPGGVAGPYIQAEGDQVLAWRAPGNIYAQRGTLAFLWRARDSLGRNQFPVFRVGYADHSSWDMVWLRIDWNGHGFDAFVTDNNLARTRVSYTMPIPRPDEWVHLAFAWDETRGVRLFVNGKLAAQKDTTAVYDAGLDQFGPHSRVISPYQVQSDYNFRRGGDIDEIRIYDNMLSDVSIAAIAEQTEGSIPAAGRSLTDERTRDEWWMRYGWNRTNDRPIYLSAPATRIRKVEFTEARDVKQRMMGGNDGIAETTWPGVYNRSRIPGRNDYFALPDWNVYVEGGKSVTFALPDEPWNHLEFQGAASGTLTYVPRAGGERRLAERHEGQERTWNDFAELKGGRLRFDNAHQETPIQELHPYNISAGSEPAGRTALTYTIRSTANPAVYSALDSLRRFVDGRYISDERQTVVALPAGAPLLPRATAADANLPLVHVMIPAELETVQAGRPASRYAYGWENIDGGLDGIAIDVPALKVQPTHGGYFPLNIQVKDPIWPSRNLLDVNVSVKPGEARTLWLDTRDRLLPNGYSLYLAIAGAGADFNARQLDGAKIRLLFKPRPAALAEHVADRFAQSSDNMAFNVEEHPTSRRLARAERQYRELTDLLRADPAHEQGRMMWSELHPEQGWPAYVQKTPPHGVPVWAFRQVESLKLVRQFVDWWIDNRQVAYGDFGGGISDDVDLTQQWPGLALMGVEPDKIGASVRALSDAVDKNGMSTNGLPTIRADELHSYEEGINVRSEDMYVHYGDPKTVERLMETARAYPMLAEVNRAGHRHVVSNLFSGTEIVREGIWQWSRPYSYLMLHPGQQLVDFNGSPASREIILGLADGWLAHGTQATDGTWTYPAEIYWPTDTARGTLSTGRGASSSFQIFQAAYRWTGDERYLRPLMSEVARGNIGILNTMNENLLDYLRKRDTWGAALLKNAASGSKERFTLFASWQLTGDKRYLERLYAGDIQMASQRMFMTTEAAWWSDRVETPSDMLQRSRLGGIAAKRNQSVPGNLVSWRFKRPENAEEVGILVRNATPAKFTVIAYNLSSRPIAATMIGGEIKSGKWRMMNGVDSNGDDRADIKQSSHTLEYERSAATDLTFAPRTTTVLELELIQPGDATSDRPDIGIGPDDVQRNGREIRVTVHNLGSKTTGPGTATLENVDGRVVAAVAIPSIAPPLDLSPKTATVVLHILQGRSAVDTRIRIRLNDGVREITQMNNVVALPRR